MSKKLIENVFAKTVELATKQNVNSVCIWLMHQPVIPKKVILKFKKY